MCSDAMHTQPLPLCRRTSAQLHARVDRVRYTLPTQCGRVWWAMLASSILPRTHRQHCVWQWQRKRGCSSSHRKVAVPSLDTHTKTARTCSTPTPRCVVCDFQHHHVFTLCVPCYFGQRHHHFSRVGYRRRGVFHSPAGGVSVLLFCEDGAAGGSACCCASPSVPAYIVAACRCWAVPKRKA